MSLPNAACLHALLAVDKAGDSGRQSARACRCDRARLELRDSDFDSSFQVGLDTILDGIEAQISVIGLLAV